VMLANRDNTYPYAKAYWTKTLATHFARIDAINVPSYKKGSSMTIGLTVQDVAYPSNRATSAARATVKVTLVGDTETSYKGTLVKAGSFQAVIPSKDLDALKAGSYTLVVEASFGTESPSVSTSTSSFSSSLRCDWRPSAVVFRGPGAPLLNRP